MTGTWYTSMVDIAIPPQATAMVNRRGAGSRTVASSTDRHGSRRVGSVSSALGSTIAPSQNAAAVAVVRTRTVVRHS